MKLISIIFLLLFTCPLLSQEVQLIKLDELNRRISSGTDTVYIINFWATWCLPCLEELPHFEKLSRQYPQSKLKILLVSMDFRSKLESTVVPFVRKRRLKNEVVLFDETNQQEYIDRIDPAWSGALPATLFIYRGKRTFFEREFSYHELLTAYKNIQKP